MIKIIKLYPKLYIGSDNDCDYTNNTEFQQEFSWATIHACKTCHQKALGYHGSMNNRDPNYLIFEKLDNLFLNMIDPETPLLAMYTNPIMHAALNFIEIKLKEHDVLIHCNQGQSRAPSIALLYLAKRTDVLPDGSFGEAKAGFTRIYPQYKPSEGIVSYLKTHWE